MRRAKNIYRSLFLYSFRTLKSVLSKQPFKSLQLGLTLASLAPIRSHPIKTLAPVKLLSCKNDRR